MFVTVVQDSGHSTYLKGFRSKFKRVRMIKKALAELTEKPELFHAVLALQNMYEAR